MKTPAEVAERKAAKAAYNAAWRAAHPDYFANWHEANREKIAARNKAHRQANIDEYKARDAASRKAHPEKHPEWVAKNRNHVTTYKAAWSKSNPEKVAAALIRARKAHPIENRARHLLNDAVRTGKVTKGACVVCGAIRTHGHHPDYSKPLDVVWLCDKHHKEAHRAAKFVGPIPGLAVTVSEVHQLGERE